MIKQSDICNYVSLIKSLKDEDCFHKIYTGYEPIYSNFFARKNSFGSNAYSRKINNSKSKNQFSKTINFPSPKQDIKKQSSHFMVSRKKNIFDIHHEQKKKKEQKIYERQYPNTNYYVKNMLFNRESRQKKKNLFLDSESYISENKLKLQRTNTGQSNSSNKFLNYTVDKIDKSQDLYIKPLQNRKKNGNTTRNVKEMEHNIKRFQSMKNSGRSSPQQFNQPPLQKLRQITKRMKESKMKLAPSLAQSSDWLSKQPWVIDPWEQPFDSRQQIPSSRNK